MRCPYCGENRDKVVDSRTSKEGAATRRRRECLDCGHRFTTYEYVEQIELAIIKKDLRREPFERQKLVSGISSSCVKRPVSVETIEDIVDRVQHRIEQDPRGEIESIKVGELVMDELAKVDQIAYIRFASVYRNFRTTEEFISQVSELVR